MKQEFFSLVENQYGVRPKALVGGAKDTKDINDWVKQQTGGLVERLLSGPLAGAPGSSPSPPHTSKVNRPYLSVFIKENTVF